MEFELQINLRRMALLATALSLWNKDNIQYKLKQYLYPYGRRGKEKFLIQLIKEVIEMVDPKSLPDTLYSELILVIKDLGYKMNSWFYYLKRRKIFRDQSRRQIYDKFFKNIFWTHYGKIDEEKILMHSWLNVPSVDLIRTYVMACCYCMEDVIRNLWGKISLYEAISYDYICTRYGYHLVAYWIKRRENDLEGFFNDVIFPYSGDQNSLYDSNQSVEVNMLRLSVRKGYISAVKYFWNKISDIERKQNIVFCLSLAFDSYHKKYPTIFYQTEQYTEIVFFLMNFITEEEKREIFEESEEFEDYLDYDFENPESEKGSAKRRLRTILKMGIFMWPWQEVFKDIFKKVEIFLDEKQYKSLIRNIIRTIEKNDKFGIPIQHSISQKQLHQAWISIPSDFKVAISKKIDFDTLFKTWSLSSVKLILNDKYLSNERQNLIKENYFNAIAFVEEGKPERFYEFINEILISQEWDPISQKNVIKLYELILKSDMNSVDEITRHYSEEEIQNLKRKIDHRLLCFYFVVTDQYEIADKFLKWKLDEEKIKNFKSSFRKSEFTTNRISKLWKMSKTNAEIAKTKSQNFLLWFLEDEIAVLRYKLKFFSLSMFEQPGFSVYFNWKKYIDGNHFEILDDFLNWCSFTPENCQIVKRTIIKNDIGVTHLMKEYMKENLVDKAQALLKWSFENPVEKQNFMRSFLLSRDGITSCKLYVGKYASYNIYDPTPSREDLVEKFSKFINFFIKPYLENADELKRELKDWPLSSIIRNEQIDEDEPSSEEIFSEGGDCEDEAYTYCNVSNYNLFLSLLDSVENKNDD